MTLTFKPLAMTLAISLMLLAGCSSSTIIHDYDKGAAWASYFTFAVQPPAQDEIDALNMAFPDRLKYIDIAIEREMTKRDYTLDNVNPDLVAIYHVKIDMRQRAITSGSTVGVSVGGGGYYGGYGGMGYQTTNLTTTYEDYAVGTVMLGLVDTRTKKLVWQATSIGELNNNSGNESSINSGARDMFFRYKYKAGKGK